MKDILTGILALIMGISGFALQAQKSKVSITEQEYYELKKAAAKTRDLKNELDKLSTELAKLKKNYYDEINYSLEERKKLKKANAELKRMQDQSNNSATCQESLDQLSTQLKEERNRRRRDNSRNQAQIKSLKRRITELEGKKSTSGKPPKKVPKKPGSDWVVLNTPTPGTQLNRRNQRQTELYEPLLKIIDEGDLNKTKAGVDELVNSVQFQRSIYKIKNELTSMQGPNGYPVEDVQGMVKDLERFEGIAATIRDAREQLSKPYDPRRVEVSLERFKNQKYFSDQQEAQAKLLQSKLRNYCSLSREIYIRTGDALHFLPDDQSARQELTAINIDPDYIYLCNTLKSKIRSQLNNRNPFQQVSCD